MRPSGALWRRGAPCNAGEAPRCVRAFRCRILSSRMIYCHLGHTAIIWLVNCLHSRDLSLAAQMHASAEATMGSSGSGGHWRRRRRCCRAPRTVVATHRALRAVFSVGGATMPCTAVFSCAICCAARLYSIAACGGWRASGGGGRGGDGRRPLRCGGGVAAATASGSVARALCVCACAAFFAQCYVQ